MGCTGEKTYEQAVKEGLHNYKLSSNQEKEIKNFISQDLTKKATALNNYQYILEAKMHNKQLKNIKN